MQKTSSLSYPHPFWSPISFGRHTVNVVKDHHSYLDELNKKNLKHSLVSLITAVGVQIGLYTARIALTKFTPANWKWKISLGFFLLHDYYALDFFKPYLLLQNAFRFAREIKKNTLVTNFSEKELNVLKTFYSYMHKKPGVVVEGHILAKDILEISTSDFVERLGQIQRLPLMGHRINGKTFQVYADFLINIWNSGNLNDSIMTYQSLYSFSKMLMLKGVIEELAEVIKLKKTGYSTELSDIEIVTLRTVKDILSYSNNTDLLDHLENSQKYKDHFELCRNYNFKQQPLVIGKLITLSEYVKEYKDLKRLGKALDQYLSLRKMALEGCHIPLEQKMQKEDYKFLFTAWGHFSMFQTQLKLLRQENKLDEGTIIVSRLYEEFDNHLDSYQEGDLLFIDVFNQIKIIEFLKKWRLSFVSDLLFTPGSPYQHLGIFMNYPQTSKPAKFALGCTSFKTPHDFHYQEIKTEERHYIHPLRIDVRALLPKSLSKEEQDQLQRDFLDRIKEICVNWDNMDMVNQLNIYKYQSVHLIDWPFYKWYRFYTFLFHHLGSQEHDLREVKLENFKKLMCSSFVMLAVIEGIHKVNARLSEKGLPNIPYPIYENEIISNLHTPRVHDLLKSSGLVSPVKVDFLEEILVK